MRPDLSEAASGGVGVVGRNGVGGATVDIDAENLALIHVELLGAAIGHTAVAQRHVQVPLGSELQHSGAVTDPPLRHLEQDALGAGIGSVVVEVIGAKLRQPRVERRRGVVDVEAAVVGELGMERHPEETVLDASRSDPIHQVEVGSPQQTLGAIDQSDPALAFQHEDPIIAGQRGGEHRERDSRGQGLQVETLQRPGAGGERRGGGGGPWDRRGGRNRASGERGGAANGSSRTRGRGQPSIVGCGRGKGVGQNHKGHQYRHRHHDRGQVGKVGTPPPRGGTG